MTSPRNPTVHKCGKEGCTATGVFGFRIKGKQIWACPDHRADAEAARDAEMKQLGGGKA